MRKVGCKAIRIGVMRLIYLQSLDQMATSEVIKLHNVIILVVTCKQNVSFQVKAVTGNGWSTNFSHWTSWLSDIPYLNSRIPSATEEDIWIFLKAFDWKNAIDMMIVF